MLKNLNNYEKLKQRLPLRRDIILIIMLLLLILIAIIFPRFKELREPIQETEIIYIEPASDENNILNLSEQQGHAIPPEIFPDTLDPDELLYYEIIELSPFDLENIIPPYNEKLLGNPLVISSPVIPPMDGSVEWTPAIPIGNMEAIYANLIYPESEYSAGIEGKVRVEVRIGADSTVLKTNIYKTSGYPALDSAAIDAVKKTKWISGTKNDQPVDMWMLLGIIFSLNYQSLNPNVPLPVEDPLPPTTIPETELPKLETPVGIVEYPAPEPIGGIKSIYKNLIYPDIKDWSNIQDRVILQAFIDTAGIATKVLIHKSCGDHTLDKAAETAIKKTKFKPAETKDGPVGVWIAIPVVFKLNK